MAASMRSFWKEISPPEIVLTTTCWSLKALVKEARSNVVVTCMRACGLEGTWCGRVSRVRLKGLEKRVWFSMRLRAPLL